MLKKGFTIMEILVVTILIGVVASLAIVNYNKLMIRNEVKNEIMKLKAINSAQEIYKARYGEYYMFYGDCEETRAQLRDELGIDLDFERICCAEGLPVGEYKCITYRRRSRTTWDYALRVIQGPLENGGASPNPHCYHGLSNCPAETW